MPKILKINMQCLLQYLKNELSYEADVLHANRRESLLQFDTFIFDVLARDAQSTQLNLQCLCDISRKKTGMKLGT